MQRAYSVLEIKAMDDDERVIEGIASTPTPDRMGDIVEPMGAKFALPMPLLWQHDSSQPIGQVEFAKPTKSGIPFKARLAKVDEAGTLKDRLDEAWQSIKTGLVRAVSIGFRSLEHAYMESGGVRFMQWEWLELSAVTIPANADATITTIRSIDQTLRAASGREQDADDLERNPPGASGKSKVVKATVTPKAPKEGRTLKTIAEQIAAFEATRQAKAARMTELMTSSSDDVVTLSAEEAEEYDTLEDEIKSIDDHLRRLNSAQALNVTKAVPVNGATPEAGSASRLVLPSVRAAKTLLPGITFSRYVLALARAQGNIMQAAEMAKANEQWAAETPQVADVLRAAVAAGTTTDSTWAGALVQYQDMAQDFAEFLRPMTILGKLRLRNVPFKTRIARQTGGASVNWVGEGKVKPLTSAAFDTVTLDFAKIAGIIVLTDETIRFSNPKADEMVRDDLAAAIVQFMDAQFLDPTKASNDVSPASVTYNVTPVTATGTTEAALRADVRTLMAQFVDNDLGLGDAVWIMSQQNALSIGMMQTSLGNPSFPGLNVNGGTFVGLPVVVSENVPATGGSPTDGSSIILLKQSEVLLADDGNVTIDASREASLQMESTPDSPVTASTTLVSMFQHNMVAIRAERYVTWKKRRDTAVGFIQNAKYAE